MLLLLVRVSKAVGACIYIYLELLELALHPKLLTQISDLKHLLFDLGLFFVQRRLHHVDLNLLLGYQLLQLVIEIHANLFELYAEVVRLGLGLRLRLPYPLFMPAISLSVTFHQRLVVFHQLQVLFLLLPQLLLELLHLFLLSQDRALQGLGVRIRLHLFHPPLAEEVRPVFVPLALSLR